MAESITFDNVTFIIALGGVAFSIFLFFRKPQESLELKQVENAGKDKLINAKIKWAKEANEERFRELSKRLEDAFLLAANHTHTVDTKVDELIKTTNSWHLEISNQMTEIKTIIKKDCK